MSRKYEPSGDLFQVVGELLSSYEKNKLYKLIKERDTGRVMFAVKEKGVRGLKVLWSEDLTAMGRQIRVDTPRDTRPKDRE